MSSPFLEQYRRWYDYERDSHAKVLKSLESVPTEEQSSPAFQRAMSIMGHLMAARQIWLYRLGAYDEPPKDFFPTGLTLDQIKNRVETVQAAWIRYLNKLEEKDLTRPFEYKSLDAGWFRNTIGDILAQLFGHSWYHRGQIAMLIRQAKGQPAATDFVYWRREPIPAPTGTGQTAPSEKPSASMPKA